MTQIWSYMATYDLIFEKTASESKIERSETVVGARDVFIDNDST